MSSCLSEREDLILKLIVTWVGVTPDVGSR